MPTFANPSGATLSLARRRKLLELAVRHQLIIIEDDAYGDLRFDGAPVPPLAALAKEAGAEEYVVHLSTLSKIVAPGLRVGWMFAAPEVLRRCVIAKQTIDLCTSPWIQYAAAQYLKGGVLERNVATHRRRLPRARAGDGAGAARATCRKVHVFRAARRDVHLGNASHRGRRRARCCAARSKRK